MTNCDFIDLDYHSDIHLKCESWHNSNRIKQLFDSFHSLPYNDFLYQGPTMGQTVRGVTMALYNLFNNCTDMKHVSQQ